jgi:HEPN domain-containing protein
MSEIETLLKRASDSLAAARNLLRDGFPDFAAFGVYYVAQKYLSQAKGDQR